MQRFKWGPVRPSGGGPKSDDTSAIQVNLTTDGGSTADGVLKDLAAALGLEALPCDVLGRRVQPGDTVVHRDEESVRKRVVRVDAHRIWTDDGLSAASRAYRRVEASKIECPSCGVAQESVDAIGILEGGRRVCRACYKPETRLECVLLGWEADPYRAHREFLESAPVFDDGRASVERPGEIAGSSTCPAMAVAIGRVEDLGRRCLPPVDEDDFDGHDSQNDHAPKPIPVDDPSGDDVAADAPGAAEYMGVRDA